MKILSSQTTMFQAKVRIRLRRKIRKMLPRNMQNVDIQNMNYKQLQKLFNHLQYAPEPPKGLDKIVKEQADYYGMTQEKLASFMSDCADAQELMEYGYLETPAGF